MRIRLSNAYGKSPLHMETASVALRESGNRIVAASSHPLTFGGRQDVIVPPGAYALSDPVPFSVSSHAVPAVSLFTSQPVESVTIHHGALTTSFSAAGNQVAATELTGSSPITSWPFLSAVEVNDAQAKGTIVALGSSITDGFASTPDANHRWTDFLANRLQADRAGKQYGVINEGIAGNRVLHDGAGPLAALFGQSAVARFDRDVLAQAGVRYVVVFEGGNDISQPGSAAAPLAETVTANDIIAGYTQLAERAHEHGIRIVLGTLTPFEGMTSNVYSPEREAMRVAVNLWIRTTPLVDGFIDVDRAILDPSHPARILPKYDSGDHLHLNDVGYQVMAEKIDLSLFS